MQAKRSSQSHSFREVASLDDVYKTKEHMISERYRQSANDITEDERLPNEVGKSDIAETDLHSETRIRTRQVLKGAKGKDALTQGYKGTILSWMEAVVHAISADPAKAQKLNKLPSSLRLGAAFSGVMLLTMMIGCGQRQKIVDCSKDETEFLDNVVDWINEHPGEIQIKMDELWPDQTITAKDLITTLNNSQIECAVGGDPNEPGHARGDSILISVDSEYFEEALDAYQRGVWTQNYSLDELVQIIRDDGDEIGVRMDVLSYYNAVAIYADVLAHEAAHIETGESHSKEVMNSHISKDMYERAEIDEIYAWGSASNLAVQEESSEADKFLHGSAEQQ